MMILCTESIYFRPIQDEIHRCRYYQYSVEELIDIVFDKSIVSLEELNELYRKNLLRVAKQVIIEFLEDSGFQLDDVEYHRWNKELGCLYIKIHNGVKPWDSYSLPYLGGD